MCRAGNVYGATPTSFLRLNAPYHVKSCTGNLDEALATLHFAIANSHNTRMHEQFAFRARIGLDKPSMLQAPKISNLGHVLPSDNEHPSPSVQQTVNKKQRHIVQVQRGSLRPCTFALSLIICLNKRHDLYLIASIWVVTTKVRAILTTYLIARAIRDKSKDVGRE
jgi:hypothetical protein